MPSQVDARPCHHVHPTTPTREEESRTCGEERVGLQALRRDDGGGDPLQHRVHGQVRHRDLTTHDTQREGGRKGSTRMNISGL